MFDDQTLYELANIYQYECGFVDTNQFRNDVLRFLYTGRLLRRYVNNNDINLRLLVNHVIILHNVFGTRATDLLLQYIDQQLHPQLYALLHTFNRLPIDYDENQVDPSLYDDLQREVGNRV